MTDKRAMAGSKAYNPQQRRAALRAFMEARGLKVTPWCRTAGLAESTLRNFLKGDSESLSERSYEALARAAHSSVWELKNEPASSDPIRPDTSRDKQKRQTPLATYEQGEEIISLLRELVSKFPKP